MSKPETEYYDQTPLENRRREVWRFRGEDWALYFDGKREMAMAWPLSQDKQGEHYLISSLALPRFGWEEMK